MIKPDICNAWVLVESLKRYNIQMALTVTTETITTHVDRSTRHGWFLNVKNTIRDQVDTDMWDSGHHRSLAELLRRARTF